MTTPLQTSVDQQYFHWSSHRRTPSTFYQEKSFQSNSPRVHLKKKAKFNDSQISYPFQAELTQKLDIEYDHLHQTIPPFTLSTVINVSVNTQQNSSSDSMKTHFPSSDCNLSLYLKDIDLHTLDHFYLPSCPNPQDYLTVDGLLTFLMSDEHRLYQKYPTYGSIDPCSTSTRMLNDSSFYHPQLNSTSHLFR